MPHNEQMGRVAQQFATAAVEIEQLAVARRQDGRLNETGPDRDGPLERLAAELNGTNLEAQLVTGQGRHPFLHVQNRHASVLSEDIYAAHGWFWFGWAERIAPLPEITTAAQRVARVLRTADEQT